MTELYAVNINEEEIEILKVVDLPLRYYKSNKSSISITAAEMEELTIKGVFQATLTCFVFSQKEKAKEYLLEKFTKQLEELEKKRHKIENKILMLKT